MGRPYSKLAGVLIRKGNLDTHTDTRAVCTQRKNL